MNGEADPDTGGLIRQSRNGDLGALRRLLDTRGDYMTLLARPSVGPSALVQVSVSNAISQRTRVTHLGRIDVKVSRRIVGSRVGSL